MCILVTSRSLTNTWVHLDPKNRYNWCCCWVLFIPTPMCFPLLLTGRYPAWPSHSYFLLHFPGLMQVWSCIGNVWFRHSSQVLSMTMPLKCQKLLREKDPASSIFFSLAKTNVLQQDITPKAHIISLTRDQLATRNEPEVSVSALNIGKDIIQFISGKKMTYFSCRSYRVMKYCRLMPLFFFKPRICYIFIYTCTWHWVPARRAWPKLVTQLECWTDSMRP